MFYYMITFEVADFVLAIVVSFAALFKCGNLCTLGYDFVAKIFDLTFYSYVANVIYIFETFNEIAFAVSRIKAFSVDESEIRFRTQLIIMLIAAAISTLPTTLITRTIAPIGMLQTGQILYQIVTQNFALDKYWTVFLFIFTLSRTLFLYVVILFINIVVIFKFRAHVLRKKKLTENKKINLPTIDYRTNETRTIDEATRLRRFTESQKKLTKNLKTDRRVVKLLLYQSLNYLIGNLPNSLSPILFLMIGVSVVSIENTLQ